jgi:hypothetical protein
LLGQWGSWGAYTALPDGKKVCFALAQATSSSTGARAYPGKPSYIFVSSRPAEKIKNEVSITIGHTFKSDSNATAAIGPASFALYTQKDGAWIKSAAEEGRMIDAMLQGNSIVVKGVTSRGSQTSDVFSLSGFAQALNRAGLECK